MPYLQCALCGNPCKNDKQLVQERTRGKGLPPAAAVQRVLGETIKAPGAPALHDESGRRCYKLLGQVWDVLKEEKESESVGARRARESRGEALIDVPCVVPRGQRQFSETESLAQAAGAAPRAAGRPGRLAIRRAVGGTRLGDRSVVATVSLAVSNTVSSARAVLSGRAMRAGRRNTQVPVAAGTSSTLTPS